MLQLELQLDALTLVFCLLRGPLTARQRVFPEHVPEYLLEACAFVRDLGQSRLSVIQVSFNLAGPPARLTPAAPLGVRSALALHGSHALLRLRVSETSFIDIRFRLPLFRLPRTLRPAYKARVAAY